MTTSCLVYPLILCVPYVDWHWPKQASYLSNIATTNNRNPNVSRWTSFPWDGLENIDI